MLPLFLFLLSAYNAFISSWRLEILSSVDSLEHVPRILAPRDARWKAMPRPIPREAPLLICKMI